MEINNVRIELFDYCFSMSYIIAFSLGMTIELIAFLKSRRNDGKGMSNKTVYVYICDIQNINLSFIIFIINFIQLMFIILNICIFLSINQTLK
jgi:hypothetical protein